VTGCKPHLGSPRRKTQTLEKSRGSEIPRWLIKKKGCRWRTRSWEGGDTVGARFEAFLIRNSASTSFKGGRERKKQDAWSRFKALIQLLVTGKVKRESRKSKRRPNWHITRHPRTRKGRLGRGALRRSVEGIILLYLKLWLKLSS